MGSKSRLILALDNCDQQRAEQLVSLTKEVGVSWFKIGLELFIQAGPEFVKKIKAKGVHVFLDLKLHDIPNTVEKSVIAALKTNADLLTLHLSGGLDMVRLANKAAQNTETKLLGVTVLTSFTGKDFKSVFDQEPTQRKKIVSSLLDVAIDAQLPGIVCSVEDLLDATIERKAKSLKFIVTPGIRLPQNAKDDQVAVATPELAIQKGATHLVVGRPITAFERDLDIQDAAKIFLEKIERV